jgi:hypothetical protein
MMMLKQKKFLLREEKNYLAHEAHLSSMRHCVTEFCSLIDQTMREFLVARQSEKPFKLSYEGFAALRYYNEFTAIDGLKGLSPRDLKEFLSDYFSSHST